MINIRNLIVRGLYDYMGMVAVPQDQIPNKPSYPYLTYKFINPYIQARGTGNITTSLEPSLDKQFEYDVVEKLELQPTMTLSINAYCKGEIDNHKVAYETLKKALDWFKHSGYMYLSDNNIVVVSIEAMGDRTALIVDNYEVRYGFDVIIRFTDVIKRRFETIEECKINSDIY